MFNNKSVSSTSIYMNNKIIAIVIATILVVCAGIVILEQHYSNDDNDSKGTIYVTMSWQKEMVEEICGDDYEVVSFLSAGTSPHSTDMTPGDITGASSASVYFYIGSGVEWELSNLSTIEDSIPGLDTVDFCSGLTLLPGDTDEGEISDPHVWTSPTYLAEFAEVVKDKLTELYPDDASTFEAGYESYTAKTTALQEAADNALSGLDGANIVIWHPAWAYLLEPYGISQEELKGPVEDSTTPSAVIAALIGSTSADNRVNIYVESASDLPLTQSQFEENGIYVTVIEVDALSTNWLTELGYVIGVFGDTIEVPE
jgi:zinc transport system substrate-binding protein